MEKYRSFLKAHWWYERDKVKTDKLKKIPPPSLQKPYSPDDRLIDLILAENLTMKGVTIFDAIKNRKTHRKFTKDPLSLEELSFLLWATQGVHKIDKLGRTKRTVPSAGARHPFETYLIINRVNELDAGVYRYLPLEHKLCLISSGCVPKKSIKSAFREQGFIARSAVIFIWTVIPYRSEWQYLMVAPKMIALDAGHICQNLYLVCEAIDTGTCAIGLYDQEQMDNLVKVDGKEEFVIYAAPVGKVK
jgi:SagB-type dehydrogenase family enzyme